ncbi:MAG TPA: VacJ family lipoprotein [Verrucomicrobiae bacterium]|nr:VacJ family lipoprotein [Verrucomicrobiae bacterium]
MKRPGFAIDRAAVIIMAVLAMATDAPAQTSTNSTAATHAPRGVVLPPSVPDPFEPMNRVFWGFNKALMSDVVKPTAKAYRFVVRKPIRTGISNFGRNVTYPGRLINNLLQRKWSGARHETDRFFCNTIAGAAGFVDVATKWKIPKSDADFGQTFGQWGWRPHFFLMLPVYGPSNDRDTVGLVADTLSNPLEYITPYPVTASDPATYFGPYSYFSYGVTYNNLSDTVDGYARFAQTEMDPYSEIQYAWTFVRQNRVADFQVKGEQDEASLETIQSVFFTFKDPGFPDRGDTRSVYIPATRKELKFTFWLQKKKAPLVYIVPGLGSHRMAEGALALAELVYQQGFSAVCLSSPYNYEFMEHASTAAMPAYTPVDAHDLHVALTQIDHKLEALHPGRLGEKALLGYSMGAFHSLYVAGTEATNDASLIKFDRYVGINTPVRLLYGVSKLDEFYQAPMEWPAGERTSDIENTFLKVAALTQNSFTPQTSLPFNAIESKFIVGVAFRLILRDLIFTSQRRHNQGILQHPIEKLHRDAIYREILQYSFKDYFDDFVIPYYRTRGIDLTVPDALEKASDLRTYSAALKGNQKVRLILNRNDFLLPDEDLAWLQATFSPSQITIFEQGGHLGNLAHPAVQKAILGALEDLKPLQKK